jgi:hypothetical protein
LSQLVLENDKVKQLIGQQKIVKTIPVPPKIFSIVLS